MIKKPKLTATLGIHNEMKLTRINSGLHLAGAVLLACCAMLPARADYFNTVTNQGPVGYWRLNETAQPPNAVSAVNQGSVGASANGAYNNYPSRGVTGPFSGSVGVQLNGLNQTVQTPYNAALNPASFTIEAWVNPASASVSGGLLCVAASMHPVSPRSGWLIYQSDGTAAGAAGVGWYLRLYAQNAGNFSINLLAPQTVVPGTWSHLVFSYDGSTAKAYINGALVSSGAPSGFVPNPDAAFSIGARSDNAFFWRGAVAEAAYYGTALTEAQIATHYSTATSNPSGYSAQVIGNSPLVYYRFAETPDPVAVNSGTKGAAGNGIYIYNAMPGQAGPAAPAYPGLETVNKAVTFDGVSGAVNLASMNLNTNTVTITAWVKPSGIQANYTGLVFTRGGTTVAGLGIDGYGGNGLGYTWNNDAATYNWFPNNDAGLPTLQDGVWAFVALVVQPSQAAIYIANGTDAASFASATNNVPHPVQAFEVGTMVGRDSNDATRYFRGSIDEVSIFNRSLKAGEVFSQFATSLGNVPARIFTDPQSPVDPVFAGDILVLSVDAGGSAPVTYQWRRNNSPILDQTNAVLSLPVNVTDSGNYDVVVQAATGSAVTSQPASVTINPVNAPVITQGIQGRTLYAGGTLNLSVAASGGALRYFWTRGTTLVASGTNSTYRVASVTAADAGTYSVVVSNYVSTASSGPVTITIPAVAAGSFEAAVVADKPEAWYRLDETSGSTTMWDAMGRHDGSWMGSPALGAPGVVSGNSGVNFDRSAGNYGSVPFSAVLNGQEFTMECWVKTADLATEICPVSSRVNTRGEWFYTRSGSWVGGVSSANANYYVPSTSAGSTILSGEWTHMAISYGTSSNGSLRVYFNGQFDGQGYVNFDRNGTGPLIIGARGLTFDAGTGMSTVDMLFNGTVDEVVFFKAALAPAQIQNHFQSGLYGANTKPVAKIQPQSRSVVVGKPVSFSAYFEGTLPIGYQWMRNGAPISGATTTALNIAAAAYSDVATYSLVASNIAGVTPSADATLNVAPVPAFANATNGLVLHLRFDGNYQDTSGRGNNGTPQGAPTLVAGKVGSGALHYSTDTTASTYNYVSLGTPADMLFGASTSFSVGYWVKLPTGYVGGDLPFLCSAINSYGATGLTFAPSYTAGGWSWYIKDNAGGTAGLYGPAASINNGQWHHLVHTFDRTAGVCTTYLDGALANTTSIAALVDFDTPGPFNIGQDPTGTYAETGSADLDDLAVWRSVLTPIDAAAIYQVGQGGTSFDTYGPVTVYLTPSAGKLIISWQAGTLLEATSLGGQWTPVSGAGAPNYTVTPPSSGTKFYKVQL